jgi:hypothetical protein
MRYHISSSLFSTRPASYISYLESSDFTRLTIRSFIDVNIAFEYLNEVNLCV